MLEEEPGSLRIGLMISAPGGQFEVRPTARPAATTAANCSRRSATRSGARHPVALDDPVYTERFVQRWTSGVAWNLDYWSRKTGKEVTRGGGRGRDLGAGRDRPLVQRGRVPRARSSTAS